MPALLLDRVPSPGKIAPRSPTADCGRSRYPKPRREGGGGASGGAASACGWHSGNFGPATVSPRAHPCRTAHALDGCLDPSTLLLLLGIPSSWHAREHYPVLTGSVHVTIGGVHVTFGEAHEPGRALNVLIRRGAVFETFEALNGQ